MDDKIKELSVKIAGEIDAHLIESIFSLFNQGVLKHYVRTPRINYNPLNYKLSIDAASGVRFEGREKLIEQQKQIEKLQAQLKEAEKVIEFYGDEKNQIAPIYEPTGREGASFTKPYILDGGKRAREYQSKYKGGE